MDIYLELEELMNFYYSNSPTYNPWYQKVWGTYNNRVDAISFVSGMPDHYVNVKCNRIYDWRFANTEDLLKYDFQFENIQFRCVGLDGPYSWRDIFDNAASEDMGEWFVRDSKAGAVQIITSTGISDESPNLLYSIRFNFKDKEGNRRFGKIDPLIKTSSEE